MTVLELNVINCAKALCRARTDKIWTPFQKLIKAVRALTESEKLARRLALKKKFENIRPPRSM